MIIIEVTKVFKLLISPVTTKHDANEGKEENCEYHQTRELDAFHDFIASFSNNSFHVVGSV